MGNEKITVVRASDCPCQPVENLRGDYEALRTEYNQCVYENIEGKRKEYNTFIDSINPYRNKDGSWQSITINTVPRWIQTVGKERALKEIPGVAKLFLSCNELRKQYEGAMIEVHPDIVHTTKRETTAK